MSENKEKKVKEEKKKGHLLLVICLIALMVLCGGLGFFLGNSDLIFSQKNSVNEKKNASDKDVSDEKNNSGVDDFSKKLLDKLNTADLCHSLQEVYFSDKKVEAKDLSNNHVQHVLLYNLSKNGFKLDENARFTSDKAHEIIRGIFGKDYDYVDESITNICPNVVYDSNTKEYVVGMPACGGACGPSMLRKVLSVNKSDDTIELTVGVIFNGDISGENPYYADYNRTVPIEVTYENDTHAYEDVPYSVSDSIYEKCAKYKMIFKIEDSNYVFVSSEPIK